MFYYPVQILYKLNIPIERQRLIVGSCVVDDCKTLADYSIMDDMKIFCYVANQEITSRVNIMDQSWFSYMMLKILLL